MKQINKNQLSTEMKFWVLLHFTEGNKIEWGLFQIQFND
jgi:hypothetical protein